MAIVLKCECGKRLKTGDENAGRQGKCPQCGARVTFPALLSEPVDVESKLMGVLASDDEQGRVFDLLDHAQADPTPKPFYIPDEPSPSPAPEARDAHLAALDRIRDALESVLEALRSKAPEAVASTTQAREYKVLTQKDKWFSGKFDPERVEGALNAYAKQGWTMKGVATASVPGFGGPRDEIIIVMER